MDYNLHLKMLTLIVIQAIFVVDVCLSFNLDIRSPVVQTGPAGSEFGFAVELHREQNTNWLLVGAPRAQTSQPDVNEGGAVFKCPLTPYDNPGACEEIPFDTTGHPMEGTMIVGSKSNQRFGYTVKSAGPDGPVVACAPLRMWFTHEGRFRFPVGGCFVARNNFNDFTEMKPCETADTTKWKRIGPVYCQAGMSAVISNDVLVMGGPGSIYWQGGLYIDYFNSRGDPAPFKDSSSLDDSYRGYSVTFGEFTGDNEPDVAVGLPRAPDHKGQVRLYTTSLIALDTLYGEQVGSYFGHTVAATDLNGDGLDDLIVGAPMYIDEDRATEGWEAGRVYVYYQDESNNFGATLEKLTGKKKRARFGFSIAAIGDMDKDGFNDFAVGAPYDGIDERGAVYIYHGRRKGARINHAQVIYPSDLNLGIGTFGYSLASGLDMDNNKYIDLLVGAYNSSTAVLLRSRPVIGVNVQIMIHPENVDLDVKNRQLPDGTMVAMFTISTCFTYDGTDVPNNMELAYDIELDSQRPLSSRAAFISNNNNKISAKQVLTSYTQECFMGEAYVKNLIRDRQAPIRVLVSYSLPINGTSVQVAEIEPILNQNMDPFAYQPVLLKFECANFHCLPDLKLTASTDTTELVIGADEPIFINVEVANDGEDAFEAVFVAQFPEGLQFVRVERNMNFLDVSVTCNEDVDNNILRCDLGNPFPESHKIEFGIKLDNIGLLGNEHMANLTMQVSSASQELQNTTADNFANITVDVRAVAQINFNGISDPVVFEIPAEQDPDPTQDQTTQDNMDTKITHEQDAGPLITHYYMLRNLGPSNIGPTSIEIKWPMRYSKDEYLLYLVSATMLGTTEEECQVIDGMANPENLTPEPESTRLNDTSSAAQTAALKGRARRQVAEAQTQEDPTNEYFDCDTTPSLCYTIKCMTGSLMAGSDQLDSVTIVIRSRLWLETVSQLNIRELTMTSVANATVLSMPYAIAPVQLPQRLVEVSTVSVPEKLPVIQPKSIPLWVYVVATMVGVFILSVIVIGLWKIGFFKRKKIQPNNQPKAMVSDDTWVEDVLTGKKVRKQ